MADNIFQNIGKTITEPVGNLWQGAYQGLAPGVFEQERLKRGQQQFENKQAEFLQVLRMIQAMPQGSPAQMALAKDAMEKFRPQISAMLGQGGYQTYGTEPSSYKRLTEPERVKASKIHTGLEPRAGDIFGQLEKALSLQANLYDPISGEPMLPEVRKKLDDRIRQLSGAPSERTKALTEGAQQWLGEDIGLKPVEPKKKRWDIWGGLKRAANLWRKTGEGIPPKISGKDKQYGTPLEEVDDLVKTGRAGVMSLPGSGYTKKSELSLPKSGDPKEFHAHRRVLKKYQAIKKNKPELAKMIVHWREVRGMPYVKIEKALELMKRNVRLETIIRAPDMREYFKEYIQ